MTTTEVHVRALHTGPSPETGEGGQWLIDCTICGPLGIWDTVPDVDRVCLDHLDGHGVDTSTYRRLHP